MNEIVKYGKNSAGNQLYLNKETGKVFVKQEDKKERVELDKKLECTFMYYNGLSYRKVGEMMDVSHVSVYNWVKELSQLIVDNCKLSCVTEISDLEIDELYTYCGKKKVSAT